MKLTYLTLLVFIVVFSNCSKPKKSEMVWEANFPIIGSQSSPRATDLNGDGVLDMVIGAGGNEYQKTDQGILAIDGANGNVLWQQEAKDQVYGSPTFYDVTGDGVDDVFIGGRSPDLKALDGKTGAILWNYQYQYQYENDPILQYARFNFYNCLLVPDQNGDGLKDILTANGGNSKAVPGSIENRFPGVLLVLDSKTGSVLAADTMPDGGETYMAPLCFKQSGSDEYKIIFGTGGETIDGKLYVATLADLMNKNLKAAQVVASEIGHGFVAPPTLADINGDEFLDIAVITHGSKAMAIDGKNYNIIWERTFPGTESSNSLAPGFFTGDDEIPDFFTFVSKGKWPDNTGTRQVMLDGRDGRIAYVDSMGCTGFSSPVVFDLNQDGEDEVILSINNFDCSKGFANQSDRDIENKLIYINFKKSVVSTIDQQAGFKNIFTTPWIGDLDKDGYLDIVHCQYYSRGDLLLFLGMRMRRISTPIKMEKVPAWSAYMGTNGDGIFLPD